MIKSVIAGAVAMAVVSFGVNAALTTPQGQGRVTFNGTVVDAPCSISQKSADQSIDFGQLSKSFLQAGGETVVAHVFGERTMATLGRLMSLLSPFDVVIWMTDGWPLYESRLKGKLHVISKRYTQRIERHNLNLRQHLARLGRKSLSFSKSVELHDKVIGHYLNIKHYQ